MNKSYLWCCLYPRHAKYGLTAQALHESIRLCSSKIDGTARSTFGVDLPRSQTCMHGNTYQAATWRQCTYTSVGCITSRVWAFPSLQVKGIACTRFKHVTVGPAPAGPFPLPGHCPQHLALCQSGIKAGQGYHHNHNLNLITAEHKHLSWSALYCASLSSEHGLST